MTLRNGRQVLVGTLIVALALPAAAPQAQQELKVRVVSTNRSPADDRLRAVFDSVLVRAGAYAIARGDSSFALRRSQPQVVPYQVNCREFEARTLAVLSPAVYSDCREQLGRQGWDLVPILVARKEMDRDEYSAAFIVGGGSPVTSLSDTSLTTIVLGEHRSASQYVAPLHRLWELGLIERPDTNAAKKRWRLVRVLDVGQALDSVRGNPRAFASVATGRAAPLTGGPAAVRMLARYYVIPQDMIAISDDLVRYQEPIRQAMLDIWSGPQRDPASQAVLRESMGLSGVSAVSTHHLNEYGDLARMKRRVYRGVEPVIVRYTRGSVIGSLVGGAGALLVLGILIGRAASRRRNSAADLFVPAGGDAIRRDLLIMQERAQRLRGGGAQT